MIKRSPIRGLTIQQRLPLFICVLLLIVIISFTWISYYSVKNEAVTAGKERLKSLTDQLTTMLSQSAENAVTATKTAAAKEPLISWLETAKPESKTEAINILRTLRPDTSWVVAHLVNAQKQIVLQSVRDSSMTYPELDSLMTTVFNYETRGAGKLYNLGGKLYYAIATPVEKNKVPVGYVVRWQRVSTSPRVLEQLSKLMGMQAKIYIGNSDGSVWTDMMNPVSYPQLSADYLQEVVESTNQAKKEIMLMVKPIRNTHWLLSVEIGKQTILESANHYLQRIIIIGAALLVIGILIAWLMSRTITNPLKKLTAATSAIASGNYSAKVAVDRRDEVGKLARAFNAMTGQVSKAKDGLEKKIVEAAEINEQLRDLSAYLQNVREDERIHIAREMHDELGQVLTGFKMDISWLRKRLAESKDAATIERLDYMLKVVDDSVKFVRKLASELRPSILDDLGLIAALEWHSHEFEKRFNIKTEFRTNLDDLNVAPVVATGLFRMYQESLTNVARHSNATKVEVVLKMIDEQLFLSIADNGKGFDVANANKKTLGLLGMKERAAMIGGHLDIISEPGKGTTIIITVNHILEQKPVLS